MNLSLAIAPLRHYGDGVSVATRAALVLTATAALWAICHPYPGVIGDSTIYLGRALADLDPAGIGRDIAFSDDGQSRFSLFPPVVKALVAVLGPADTGLVVSGLASACSLASMAVLARVLAPAPTAMAFSPAAMAIVLALTALPTTYGELGIFHFAEPAALPRPFAEAAITIGLAALIAARVRLSLLLLCIATVLHPLMALVGWSSAFVFALQRLAPSARRLAVAVIAGAAVTALILAGLHAPLIARLLVPIDPEWLDLLVKRSPHLFPTLWSDRSFCPILAQVTAILLAASRLAPRARAMSFAVAVSALAMLAAAAVLGDVLHSSLVLQMQLWRGTWLLAVVGGACFVLAMHDLWQRGDRGRLGAIVLVLTWFVEPNTAWTAALCLASLALRFGRFELALRANHLAFVAIGAAALLALWLSGPVLGFIGFVRSSPTGVSGHLADALRNGLHTVPLCLGIAFWWLSRGSGGWVAAPLLRASTAAAVAVLVVVAALNWDQRSAFQRYIEAGHPPLALAAASGREPGSVLWLDALAEPWFLLHRPQWWSAQQAVGAVFSRSLAIRWRQRAEALAALGLTHHTALRPRDAMAPDDQLRVTPAIVAAFCRRPDAPALVIVPLRDNRPALESPRSTIWPVPERWDLENYSIPEWHVINAVQAISCRAPQS